MIEIVVNGEARPVPQGSGLLELLAAAGRDPRTVAVEYNGEIVPRERYGEVHFAPGDRVEIVHFVQGGRPRRGGGESCHRRRRLGILSTRRAASSIGRAADS